MEKNVFYRKIFLLILILSGLCMMLDVISLDGFGRSIVAEYTNSQDYISESVGSDEIKPYIKKVQNNDHSTKLIIGDSVCNQMMDSLQPLNEDICIAGTNSAIALTGQYILAKEYIENHEKISDIYMFLLPGSLEVTFTTTLGYQYEIMPFVETDTIQLLDSDTLEKMQSVYGKWFMRREIVEWIDKSAINRKIYLNMLDRYSHSYQQLSRYEIADQYLKKIYDLCDEKDIKLHLIPCPVPESQREYMENKKADYQVTWMYEKFPEYMEKILYIPDNEFKDGVHFGGEYATQECYNEKIKVLFADTTLIQDLKLN